jgi:hypothetical protein
MGSSNTRGLAHSHLRRGRLLARHVIPAETARVALEAIAVSDRFRLAPRENPRLFAWPGACR